MAGVGVKNAIKKYAQYMSQNQLVSADLQKKNLERWDYTVKRVDGKWAAVKAGHEIVFADGTVRPDMSKAPSDTVTRDGGQLEQEETQIQQELKESMDEEAVESKKGGKTLLYATLAVVAVIGGVILYRRMSK